MITKEFLLKLSNSGKRPTKIRHAEVTCDKCGVSYTSKLCIIKKRRLNKLSYGKDICTVCISKLNIEKIVAAGTKTLKARSPEQKVLAARMGGKANKGSINSGRFTSDRWNAMPLEKQREQVSRASNAFQEKLKDPKFAEQHYLKVLKGRIGFISKGQQELYEKIKDLGFESEVVIERIQADMLNKDLKIVVEFNGDAYHCNPKQHKPDFYSTLIRMTAKEKWEKDRKRFFFLTRLGYCVIVVWESDWKKNSDKCINKIKDEINKKRAA